MNKMSKRNINTINLIISILVAFSAWLYVAYGVSPTVTKTYHNVKITYEGEYELGLDGMGVLKSDVDSINVTVSLKRTDVSRVSSDNIIAKVNVKDANKGTNNLPISVETPDGVTYKSQSLDTVNVEVTESNNVDVAVTVGYTDVTDASTEPYATEIGADLVSVMGAKDLVDQVEYVVLNVNEDVVADGSPYTFTGTPVAVDKTGKVVPHIVVMPNTVRTTVVASDVKAVALNVPVKDSSSSSKSYEVPKTVKIKGDKKVLDATTQISAEEVDITDMKENSSVAIELILPDGVQVANASRSIKLKVISK